MERNEGTFTDGSIAPTEAQELNLPSQGAQPEVAELQRPEAQPEPLVSRQTPETTLQMLRQGRDKEVLAQFNPKQQKEIETKQKLLSSLAYFIGKDFKIPVRLNEPGTGWHWDFKDNIIRVDPKDLLEQPMDYLRCIISHEGGHRRISRMESIPLETWAQPGFGAMMNAIEDPRVNNFVAENYPKFREQMKVAYDIELEKEKVLKVEAKDKLGHQPRFMQASFEYIKQWLKESSGGFGEVSEDLPDDVKEVVAKTLPSAQDAWWRYPSRQEADKSEQLIKKYAQTFYEINRDEIWPEFKKLVDEDIQDEKMEQQMRDIQKQFVEGGESGQGQPQLPQELKDRLTPEQQQELQGALQQAIDQAKEKQEQNNNQPGKPTEGDEQETQEPPSGPVDLESLSEETKQKIREYIDSLPEEVKQDLQQRAEEMLRQFEETIKEELRGKLNQDPEQHEGKPAGTKTVGKKLAEQTDRPPLPPEQQEEVDKFHDLAQEAINKDANIYEEKRREVLETIDKLEDDLRAIFVARRAHNWESGFRSGKHIDIKRRIQEKAKDVPAMESHAWERRETPREKDYAISLLVDLSGSMRGQKINETFKAAIVLSEVLNRLSIDNEILGFNDRIHVFKGFHEAMSDEVRDHMGGMLQEVSSDRAAYNDDGWALGQASQRLAQQGATEKFLIPLSDGNPEPSHEHSGSEYELGVAVRRIQEETNQKLIGLGIGPNTEHVAHYYPNSLANVNAKEMADQLAELIREVIEGYDQF
ncbi:MAG: hypothetical protein AAB669_03795 [Patescibacteria group bacterium]